MISAVSSSPPPEKRKVAVYPLRMENPWVKRIFMSAKLPV
jgi:hypothetical protein